MYIWWQIFIKFLILWVANFHKFHENWYTMNRNDFTVSKRHHITEREILFDWFIHYLSLNCGKFSYLCNGIGVSSVKVFHHIAICIFPVVVSVVNVWHFIRSRWTRTKVFKRSLPAGYINGYPCYIGDIYILKKIGFNWIMAQSWQLFHYNVLQCTIWYVNADRSRSGIVSNCEYSDGDSHVTNSQSNLSTNDVMIAVLDLISISTHSRP